MKAFLPYASGSAGDRADFTSAVLGLFKHIDEELTTPLDFNDLDMARRRYGASGGRVGLSARILAAALNLKSSEALSADGIARGADACLQTQLGVERFFQSEPPDPARMGQVSRQQRLKRTSMHSATCSIWSREMKI